MWMQSLIALALAGLSSSHFLLQWPPTAGFDDDLETTAPCGSFTPEVNSSSPKVQVGRFAVSIKNVHPEGQWIFRGTTNTAAPYNFTDIVPTVRTTGIGDFCLNEMTVPSEWAGKEGIIQVIDHSPDGVLYQCAPVNFVSGKNTTLGPTCTNGTEVSATWSGAEPSETPQKSLATRSIPKEPAANIAFGVILGIFFSVTFLAG